MNKQLTPLNLLPLGRFGVVIELNTGAQYRRRLQDLGLITGTVVEAVLKGPGGDPMAFNIRGALIALRSSESGRIMVGLQ